MADSAFLSAIEQGEKREKQLAAIEGKKINDLSREEIGLVLWINRFASVDAWNTYNGIRKEQKMIPVGFIDVVLDDGTIFMESPYPVKMKNIHVLP
jgi:hypothetical protein